MENVIEVKGCHILPAKSDSRYSRDVCHYFEFMTMDEIRAYCSNSEDK